jgi:hypothetical protein
MAAEHDQMRTDPSDGIGGPEHLLTVRDPAGGNMPYFSPRQVHGKAVWR